MKRFAWLLFLSLLFLYPTGVHAQDVQTNPTLGDKPVPGSQEFITPLTPEPISIDDALKRRLNIIGKPARNIILVIPDGMCVPCITIARAALVGKRGFLELDRLPVTARVISYPADGQVNDSAAAGSELATGREQVRNMISCDANGKPVQTLFERARDLGFQVGLITDTRITHATPAVFAAHVRNRDDETVIAQQLIKSNFDLLFGGGKDFFLPEALKGKQTKDLNLLDEARLQGYFLAEERKDLPEAASGKARRVLGLFSPSFMPYSFATTPETPSLAEMTAAALAILGRNGSGFLLMVEAGQIDACLHARDVAETVNQMASLEETLRVIKEFVKTRSDTLLVVVPDHGTAGLVLGDRFSPDLFRQSMVSTMAVARQAFGHPEHLASLLRTTYPRLNFIPDEIARLAVLKDRKEFEKRLGVLVFDRMGVHFPESGSDSPDRLAYEHTGEDLVLHAMGCHQSLFTGVLRTWEIPRRLAAALGFAFP